MKISASAIHRPVFTIMVTLVVIILGGIAFLRLPIDLMPDITNPTLSISTGYENASPEEMEELVTRPIEEAMSAVPGVEEVTSSSSEGNSSVRLNFAWGTDLDAAATDVRDRLDRVIGRLPDDADRPSISKFDLASFPILMLGAASDLDPVQMREIVDDQVKYRIERVPGVASLDVWGGLEREIHVNVYPDKVKALGLSLDQIVSRIRAENINLPAGTVDRGNLRMMLRTPGQYSSLDELRNTIVAVRQGATIRLSEVARVEDTHRKITRSTRVNGRNGIRMSVNKQSGKNTVEVARRVLEEIELINRDIPQINLVTIMDTSEYIEQSISNVGNSALYGGVLAILVLLMFLRSVRTTAIIACAIPVSVIATFALMYFSGMTLNLMTLGGLALGVGMLVDNSIVVLENIYRLRESGMPLKQAALEGTEEVGAAIVASTLTTVVVFLPLVFMRGMAGVMFKQLSYVIGFALLCSLAVAMTLIPTMSARLIRSYQEESLGRETLWHKVFRATGRWFSRLEESYASLLGWSLDHRWIVVAAAVALLAGSVALVPLVGSELMPAADEGEVRVNIEGEVGSQFEITDARLRDVERIVAEEVPEVKGTVSWAGGGGWGSSGGHTASMRIALLPQRLRARSSEEIAEALRKKLSEIPGMTVRTRAGGGLFVLRMGMGGGERVEVEIRGYDLEVADALADRVKAVVDTVQGVTDSRVSRDTGSPEQLVMIDRQKAADMKLTVSQIANMLQTVLSGTRASDYREGGDEYPIRVQVDNAGTIALDEVLDLTVTNVEGVPVVLRNVITLRERAGPVRIERADQDRIVTVSGNATGRDMGSVLAEVDERIREIPVPRDFNIALGGDYEDQQEAFRELLLSFSLAVVLVYMVMACQYESLRDPLVVMFSVPMAAIGVVLLLFLTNTTFNMQSYIGCIMLAGIVVNNAILLVDHTNLLRRRDGFSVRAAIEEAGRRRLRPILMTAMTTCLGLLPLGLGLGEGGEAQAPLARSILGGLVSATMMTLVFVPVVYSLFEGKSAHAPSADPPPQG